MAQTSINAFFTKKDTTHADYVEPTVRLKQEPGTESENGGEESKDEPKTNVTFGQVVIPKIEPEDFPPSDESPILANEFDSTIRIKTEPDSIQLRSEKPTVLSILSKVSGSKFTVSATESPSNEKSDECDFPNVKKEFTVYPPSDEDTDVEMEIYPTLANDVDPTVTVKTEPKTVPVPTVISILSGVFGKEYIAQAIETSSKTKLNNVNQPFIKEELEEYPPSDEDTDVEMDIDSTLATGLHSTAQLKTESIIETPKRIQMSEKEINRASVLNQIPQPERQIESTVQTEVTAPTASTSKFVHIPTKRKPDSKLEKDDGKKQKVFATSSKESDHPNNSVSSRFVGALNEISGKDAESTEVLTK